MPVKLLSAVLMSLMIVLAGAGASSGALSSSRVFAQEEESAEPMVTLIADGVIRAWPSSSSDFLGAVPARSSVPVTGRTVDFTWWQISFASGPGGHAWIAATVVRPNAAVVSVPVIQVIQPTPGPVTPTPEPTPNTCTLDAAFVADVTIPDGTMLMPTEVVNKVWRLRNTGTCAWENVTVLKFVGGFQMGAQDTADVPYTAPGETADIAITAYAPAQGGQYRSVWQLLDEGVNYFGPKITMIVGVNGPAQPTPAPAPAPVQPTPAPPPPPPPPPPKPVPGGQDRLRGRSVQDTVG